MKRIMYFLFAVALLLLISDPAYSLSYYEPETGASFSLPDGWSQTPLYEEREFIDVKYLSPSGESYLMFGCIDLWEYMTAFFKANYTRAEINSDFFSEEEIADFFAGSYYEKVRKERIASNDYFILENDVDFTTFGINEVDLVTYGINDEYYMYYAIFIQNGYAYAYQLYTTATDVSWDDFKSFLSNISYPEGPTYSDIQSAKLSKRLIAAAVLASFSVGVVLLIKHIKRKNKDFKTASITKGEGNSLNNSETTKAKSAGNTNTFSCPYCGRVLPKDSKFCSFCGETVIKKR